MNKFTQFLKNPARNAFSQPAVDTAFLAGVADAGGNKKLIILSGVAVVFIVGLIFFVSGLRSTGAEKDFQNIRPIAEKLYDNEGSYASLCLNEDLLKIAKKRNCHAEARKWIVYKSFGFSRSWCADYQGRVVKLKQKPEISSFVCK